MTTTPSQALSIEFDQAGRGYGHLHKTGCRDLRDPERLGEHTTRRSALDAALDMTGWEDDDCFAFAPCVTLPK